MPRRTPNTLLSNTVRELEASLELTTRAEVWRNSFHHFQPARFKKRHYSQIVELAFLKSFLTWEIFLEEAFILYLLGEQASGGYKPIRYATPLNRQHASDLLASDMRHIDWTAADRVIERANRFFKKGQPFSNAIRPHINLLNNVKTIRNAIAHASGEAGEKFRVFVRNELTYYPKGMEPGLFLMTIKPKLNPPKTYFQFYTENFQLMIRTIFPS